MVLQVLCPPLISSGKPAQIFVDLQGHDGDDDDDIDLDLDGGTATG